MTEGSLTFTMAAEFDRLERAAVAAAYLRVTDDVDPIGSAGLVAVGQRLHQSGGQAALTGMHRSISERIREEVDGLELADVVEQAWTGIGGWRQ